MKKYTVTLIILLAAAVTGCVISAYLINKNRTAFGYEYQTIEGDSKLIENLSFRLLLSDETENYQYWDAEFQIKNEKPVVNKLTQYSENESIQMELYSETKKQLNQYGTIDMSFMTKNDKQMILQASGEEYLDEQNLLYHMNINQRYTVDDDSTYEARMYLLDYTDRYRTKSFYFDFPAIDVSGNDFYVELNDIQEGINSSEYVLTRTEPGGQSISQKEGSLVELDGKYYFTLQNKFYLGQKQEVIHQQKQQGSTTGESSVVFASETALPSVEEAQTKELHYTAVSGIWCITEERELTNLYPLEITDQSDFIIRHLSAVPETNTLVLLIEREKSLYVTTYQLDTGMVEEEVFLYRLPEDTVIQYNPFIAYPDKDCMNLLYQNEDRLLIFSYNTKTAKVEGICDLTDFQPGSNEDTEYYIQDIRNVNGRFNIMYSMLTYQNDQYTSGEFCLCIIEDETCVYKGILSLTLMKEDTDFRAGNDGHYAKQLDYLIFD